MLNPNCFTSVVSKFMATLHQVETDMIADGYMLTREFSAWGLEQSIINREPGKTMMSAAEDWLENCENLHLS